MRSRWNVVRTIKRPGLDPVRDVRATTRRLNGAINEADAAFLNERDHWTRRGSIPDQYLTRHVVVEGEPDACDWMVEVFDANGLLSIRVRITVEAA